jgi:23S rRNA (cytosine1962-C5)-methyltransferase
MARPLTEHSPTALLNRLEKRARHLGRWAQREGTTAYRVFDRDIPSYHFAVDRFGDWAAVHEYPWQEGDPRHEARRAELLAALPVALGIDPGHLVTKVHLRHRWGESQYEKGEGSRRLEVREGGLRFEVDLGPYLDTGLFLDHRGTRALVRERARGRRFLNLFCYTGSFSVYAAAGGAASTTSVDLSNSYLDWLQRNLELNQLAGPKHDRVRADVLQWLPSAAKAGQHFDLIVLDPPSHSDSKKMEKSFEVQRDHPRLLAQTLELLSPDGTLIFSANFQQFELEARGLEAYAVKELTPASLPEDFKGKHPHRAWRIGRPGSAW